MNREEGFSLIEALVATAIVTSGVAALAKVTTLAVEATTASRTASVTALLAAAKLEDLESRAWSDLEAMTCPEAALVVRADGCADDVVLAGALYVRQWAVTSAPGSIGTTTMQVVVARWGDHRPASKVRLMAARSRWRL